MMMVVVAIRLRGGGLVGRWWPSSEIRISIIKALTVIPVHVQSRRLCKFYLECTTTAINIAPMQHGLGPLCCFNIIEFNHGLNTILFENNNPIDFSIVATDLMNQITCYGIMRIYHCYQYDMIDSRFIITLGMHVLVMMLMMALMVVVVVMVVVLMPAVIIEPIALIDIVATIVDFILCIPIASNNPRRRALQLR